MRSCVVACALALACASAPAQRYSVDLNGGEAVVLADQQSQTVFEEAFAWSKEHNLETGGCFQVFSVKGNKIIIIDAVEKVVWRRVDHVQFDCDEEKEGIWHTHYAPESATTVGCNLERSQDLYLISPKAVLGIVVCGLGQKNFIPYSYSAAADSNYRRAIKALPDLKAHEDSLKKEMNAYRCADESKESLQRPGLRCR